MDANAILTADELTTAGFTDGSLDPNPDHRPDRWYRPGDGKDQTYDPETGWTDRQICPLCGQPLGDCDWCSSCDIQLLCAQADPSTAEKLVDDDGRPYLVLGLPDSTPPCACGTLDHLATEAD